MEKSELKIKYKEDFKKVSAFVNEFDPCGLIKIGATLNEYDSLTNNILSFTYEKKTREEIKTKIIYEIEFSFGCVDLSVMEEQYKSKFYRDVDALLDKLEKQFP